MTDWEAVKEKYIKLGYVLDVDDEKRLGFSKYVDEKTEWMIDFYKKTGDRIFMNGRQIVNLVQKQSEKIRVGSFYEKSTHGDGF